MVGIGLLAGLRTRVPSIPSLRADIDIEIKVYATSIV